MEQLDESACRWFAGSITTALHVDELPSSFYSQHLSP
jgi:hypothetical protein